MAESSQIYKTKFRVDNKIFETYMLQDLFEDLRVRGKDSSVVHGLNPESAISTVVGEFKYPVEILSVFPCTIVPLEPLPQANAEAMETQVSNFRFYFLKKH